MSSELKGRIDELSSSLSLGELAGWVKVLEEFQRLWLTENWWIHPDLSIIQDAIKLKVESMIYLFHTKDELSDRNLGNWEWISIHERTWNILINQSCEDNIPGIEQVIEFLQNRGIKRVITWPINGGFLWISEESTLNTNNSGEDFDDLIYTTINIKLNDEEIKIIEDAWIEVEVLDELI